MADDCGPAFTDGLEADQFGPRRNDGRAEDCDLGGGDCFSSIADFLFGNVCQFVFFVLLLLMA